MVARAPRKRMYRTMQGRMVDIEKLRAANESVRAVGNMAVNTSRKEESQTDLSSLTTMEILMFLSLTQPRKFKMK